MTNSNQDLSEVSKKNYECVFLKKQFDSFGDEEILNELGQIIGKIEIPFFKLNRNLKIRDLVNNKTIIVERKNNLFFKIRELKNHSGELFAKIRMARIPFFSSKITFADNKGKKQYVATGDFKYWNYKIINTSNNAIIAKIKVPKMKNSLIQKLKLSLSDFYYLKIINKNIEKINIISFAISINNFVHNSQGISDIAGFERRIARLRPFGPGRSLN